MNSEIMYKRADGWVADVNIRYYPSGEPLITDRALEGCPIVSILLRPKSMNSFMAAYCWIQSLSFRGNGGISPRLIFPFALGARQDRLNGTGDALFTAKTIADLINSLNLSEITLLDPHSDVFPALIENPVRIINTVDCMRTFSNWQAVIAPDAGARKRAELVGVRLKLPVIQAWKTRDVTTGEISGFGIEPFELKGVTKEGVYHRPHVLVVDDICDGGGTFVGLADKLDENNVIGDLFITHGLFSKGTKPIGDRYRYIYCTDSILGNKAGVEVNNICERLL